MANRSNIIIHEARQRFIAAQLCFCDGQSFIQDLAFHVPLGRKLFIISHTCLTIRPPVHFLQALILAHGWPLRSLIAAIFNKLTTLCTTASWSCLASAGWGCGVAVQGRGRG